MEGKNEIRTKIKELGFWQWAIPSVIARLILSYFAQNLKLSTRPEVSTPLTSMRRLAEGYSLKQLGMSPYSGSMFHGSPLLLSILGPLTVKKDDGQPNHVLSSLVSVVADLITAILIRATGHHFIATQVHNLSSLGIDRIFQEIGILPSGDIAALMYLWNPFTVISCMSFNTSPIENLFIILSVFGASAEYNVYIYAYMKGYAGYSDNLFIGYQIFIFLFLGGLIPLAAFGWVIASHLSLYPLVLVVPMILLLGFGLDAPPRKLFVQNKLRAEDADNAKLESLANKPIRTASFSWRRAILFILWASIWISYVLILCSITMKEYGGLREMFKRTYGFILTVKDLSPNIGVLWYFFAEVFDFFRNFFLMVFHANILFMILPLAIRLNHRPCFLACVYLSISSMLKSYPSVGDSALYMSLLALFVNELAEMRFSFFVFFGYVGVSLLSPVMHNLWIWRGTGNANFYFATAMAYACFQIILVIESVTTMINYDRKMKKLCDAAKM